MLSTFATCSSKSLKVLILVVSVVVFLIALYGFTDSDESKVHKVVLSKDGFIPQNLRIHTGDRVTFSTRKDAPFWPASDLHPSHSAYPDFDPQMPVGPDASWSFTFTEDGVYTFHDHLNPLHLGSIVVGVDDILASVDMDVAGCNSATERPTKLRCWDNLLVSEYDHKGLPGAFSLYESLFKSEPDFAQECHSYTHTIGKKALEEYVATGDFGVTDQIAYCSYGFFHGFMDSLVQYTGDYGQSRDFCDIIDAKIGEQTNVYTACLHGIGHGVTDGYDPSAKGNALAIVNPGLKLCRAIGRTPYEIKICATGVFNSLAAMYESGDVPYDPNNPLAVCSEFGSEPDIKAACFDDMKTLLAHITNYDYVASAKFIEAIPEDHFAVGAIDNLSTYRVYRLLENGFEEGIRDCYRIQERLQAGCVRGISVGFMVQGTPGEEYVEAIAVCRSPLVHEEHRTECFDRTMEFAKERYSQSEHQRLCESVADVYSGYGCR